MSLSYRSPRLHDDDACRIHPNPHYIPTRHSWDYKTITISPSRALALYNLYAKYKIKETIPHGTMSLYLKRSTRPSAQPLRKWWTKTKRLDHKSFLRPYGHKEPWFGPDPSNPIILGLQRTSSPSTRNTAPIVKTNRQQGNNDRRES